MGYLGGFLLGFLGAVSIFIPIPYTVVLLGMGAVPGVNLFLLAAVAGLGAAVGETLGYGIGYAGRRFVNKKHDRRFNAMMRIFDRFGMLAVFLFALTPLPDDILIIPLGMMRYNFWKVLIPCVAGKFLMSLVIVHAGAAAGQAIMTDSLFAVVTMVLLVLVMVAMFKLDWEKLVQKYLPEKNKEKKKK